ncbi:MAG TPA: AgmX/PglI C-terminal domain-containing protein [Spirochaetota bacterium]|nr:AgmX/PglI C-terminal domain-containing protein [Spirochaetota bacterium]
MKTATITITALACLALLVSACAKLNPKTEGQIYSALEAKADDFRKCYEKALKDNRDVKGDVEFKLKFDPKGTRPESVSVEKSTIQDDKMLKCVTKVADKISIEDAPEVFIDGFYTVSFQFDQPAN